MRMRLLRARVWMGRGLVVPIKSSARLLSVRIPYLNPFTIWRTRDGLARFIEV
jgi:hypothetical protein